MAMLRLTEGSRESQGLSWRPFQQQQYISVVAQAVEMQRACVPFNAAGVHDVATVSPKNSPWVQS